MRTVRLNGALGKKYGRIHKLAVKTPAEAVRALCANYPEFYNDLAKSHEKGVAYKCILDKERVGEDALAYPISRSFSITPVVAGAGKVGTIILGIALIATAFLTFGASLAVPAMAGFGAMTTTGIGFLGLTYANIAWLGVAITLSGVSQLLSPSVKQTQQSGQQEQNNYFNGPVNATAQGIAVPVGYGRMIVGSAVISAAITVEDKPIGYDGSGNIINPYDLPLTGFAVF